MKLYGSGQSRSFRGLWALEETGLPYEYKEAIPGTDATRSEDYRDLNFQGKVPTLVDGDLVITESGAILNYLAKKKRDLQLMPFEDPKLLVRYDVVCFFILSDFEQPLWTNGKHRFVLPKERRVSEVLETANWEFARSQKALVKLMGDSDFAVGSQFSMADVLVAHTINWADRFKFEVVKSLLIYRDRMYERKACQKAMDICLNKNN
ncbi:MAG: glutathione S-transferase family protein [Proteobacteria bacterium]|nr:glutathione S-transferase family protein [Pseudomonadota bacterium]